MTSIVAAGGFLYSASLNGSIKMWDAQVGSLCCLTLKAVLALQ